MKVTLLSESSADEAAVRILIEAILGKPTEPVALPPLRARGWASVFQVLPGVLTHLHYRTDAEAFVVVVDSDTSPAHQQTHDDPDNADEKCRLCQLRELVAQTQKTLRLAEGRMLIKIAIGLAVPAIEAWYRCGLDAHATEAMLIQQPLSGITEIKRRLKKDVYGTDRPSIELETKRAIEEATRLAQDLGLFEACFPGGFGALARDVRNW